MSPNANHRTQPNFAAVSDEGSVRASSPVAYFLS